MLSRVEGGVVWGGGGEVLSGGGRCCPGGERCCPGVGVVTFDPGQGGGCYDL